MIDKINTPQPLYSANNSLKMSSKDKSSLSTPAYIKQRIHDKKIDEFFWTNMEAPKKRTSVLAAIGSVIGVITPILLFSKHQNTKLKIDSLKNLAKSINIKYELKEILGVGIGGAMGGLAGGLLDRNERNKIDKIEEGVFQLMNIAFPALLVAGAIKICEQSKQLNKSPVKLLGSAFGMYAGVNLAVNLSNKLDDKFFDKYNHDPERKFKKKDLIVHVDDLIGALVLAKIPFAEKLHAEKILPVIFAWSGYHVGET
jgi:hypothetical protein